MSRTEGGMGRIMLRDKVRLTAEGEILQGPYMQTQYLGFPILPSIKIFGRF